MKKLISIIISAVLLCSCSLYYDESGSTAPDTLPLAQAGEDITAALSKQYSNLVISPDVFSSVPKALYKPLFTSKSGFSENAGSIIPDLLYPFTPAEDAYQTDDDDGSKSIYVYDTENKQYCCVRDCGSFCLFKDEMFDMAFLEGRICCNLLRGEQGYGQAVLDKDAPAHTVPWAEGIARDYVNAHIAKYLAPFELVPCEVRTLKTESGAFFRVRFCYFLDGVKLCAYDSFDNTDEDAKSFTFAANSSLDVYINSSGEVHGFSAGTYTLDVEKNEQLTDIIPLSRALMLVQEQFSDRLELDVVSVSLKYIISTTQKENYLKYNITALPHDARAVWELLILPPQPDFEGGYVTSVSQPYYINVDALTGEIDLFLGGESVRTY